MRAKRPVLKNIIAIMAATTAALFGRAWLQLELLQDGLQPDYAADLSYLVVPPVLLALLFPLLRDHKTLIVSLFSLQGLTLRLLLSAVTIGILLRLSAWCQLAAGVSFGLYRNVDPNAMSGPTFSFDCAAPHILALGFVVMALIVPVVEEVLNRGLIQSWLSHRGPVTAVVTSAFLFMLLHKRSTWGFAFVAGIVLGIQFWRTRSLWFSLVTHATVNSLIQIDWRCLHGRWNPPASQLPMWGVGIPSVLILAAAVSCIVCLLRQEKAGVQHAPR